MIKQNLHWVYVTAVKCYLILQILSQGVNHGHHFRKINQDSLRQDYHELL